MTLKGSVTPLHGGCMLLGIVPYVNIDGDTRVARSCNSNILHCTTLHARSSHEHWCSGEREVYFISCTVLYSTVPSRLYILDPIPRKRREATTTTQKKRRRTGTTLPIIEACERNT
mmetsp:Transcript_7437/g.7322  ORF Transcript_7437/g.7322 Transcript_7437/m.7322 type:complete len:116 (+) Transcript_7437:277-624(+)